MAQHLRYCAQRVRYLAHKPAQAIQKLLYNECAIAAFNVHVIITLALKSGNPASFCRLAGHQ
jgi:hypothetical protein